MATSTGSVSLGNSHDVYSWKDWSIQSNGLRWRMATPDDTAVLTALMDQVPLRWRNLDRPDLFKSPVLLTLVAEDAEGTVVDGCYVEAVCEVVKLCMTPAGFNSMEELAPWLRRFMTLRGFRICQVTTPRRLARYMRAILELCGFHYVDDELSHFKGRLRS